ncbi:RNA pseudouridine synthase [Alicyclobacillus contaminans]|uniref:pseudouridine synthase n=1 Tax=Alicyclobacillus contaminans TaxID=392016 RepID=UPI000428A2FC|nr:pseudouridine synthase [Alicyclobacillus contaminans]GMA52479.1 RNA pseudouridine synthase [Alicyclobacillus contaminans]
MERLQKILAQAGIASRRKAEEWILAGRVSVNGKVVRELGVKATPGRDTIAVDDQVITVQRTVNIVLHKPTSYVTTVVDPEGRRTVMELIEGVAERVYPVGRLDYETSGLLLLSNDGDLTHRLLHPSHHVDKVYRATVLGLVEREALDQLRRGVRLEDGVTAPAEVTVLRQHPLESVVEIRIHEGRNRQVRRMFETVGNPVKRLKRVQFGPLELGTLPPGKWRWLTELEWQALYAAANLPAPPYPFSTREKASSPRDRGRNAVGQKRFGGAKRSR